MLNPISVVQERVPEGDCSEQDLCICRIGAGGDCGPGILSRDFNMVRRTWIWVSIFGIHIVSRRGEGWVDEGGSMKENERGLIGDRIIIC